MAGFDELYALVKQGFTATRQKKSVLFFSASDMQRRAIVKHWRASTGETFEQAWQRGLAEICQALAEKNICPTVFRVDWVEHAQAMSYAELKESIGKTRRNYFRYGIAFDKDFSVAFTEMELNANAMLYPGGAEPKGVVNENNFLVYARQRFPQMLKALPDEADTVYKLTLKGAFVDGSGQAHSLYRTGLNAGRREGFVLQKKNVAAIVKKASNFLARQVNFDGSFVYGSFPCFDRTIASYNALRHISSTYAMLEAWEVTKSAGLKKAIHRSLQYMLTKLVHQVDLPQGQAAFILENDSQEMKLGANGVALLLLVKHADLWGGQEHFALMEQLALGILHMQNPQNGEFVHVLKPDATLKEAFRIVYYDGEAVFGLLRLYGLTKDERWLEASCKAFDAFIKNEHWKNHDHWLSYAVNEITLHLPEEKYFRFGLQNVAGILDFVQQRETVYPTLLELMMAAESMLRRLEAMPQMVNLLEHLDKDKFHRALTYRANYLMNGYFWPEYAMFFKNPQRIVDSFFIRHHSFRVRIDDVEHYLSGLVAYLGCGEGCKGKKPISFIFLNTP